MLETLDDVPWSDLGHAGDVPAALRALLSDDADVRKKALWSLNSSIVHQGTRYEVSAQAVPFLLEMVADPTTPGRAALIELLVTLAIGNDESYLPDGFPVDELRAAGGADSLDEDQDRVQARIELDAYAAVEAGVPLFVSLLDDADPAVRRMAAYALGWFPSAGLAGLRDAAADDEPAVAATALIALGLLGAAEPAGDARDRAAATALGLLGVAGPAGDSREVVTGAAAIALARLQGRDAGPEVAAELLRRAAGATRTEVPYLGGDLSGYAALSLRLVLGEESDEAFDVLLTRLAAIPALEAPPATADALPVAAEALRRAFPDGPVPPGTPFDDLTERQKRVVRALAAAPSVWQPGDFIWLVGGYGLPNDVGRMLAYAGPR